MILASVALGGLSIAAVFWGAQRRRPIEELASEPEVSWVAARLAGERGDRLLERKYIAHSEWEKLLAEAQRRDEPSRVRRPSLRSRRFGQEEGQG